MQEGPSQISGNKKKKIFFIAGEASGDLHGSQLVKSLLVRNPNISIYGIGGNSMAQAGMRLVFHSSDIAVMGIVEIIRHLKVFYNVFKWIKRSLDKDPPDLVVLIDFPDFNLRVAREVAKRGIPVVYYISPQVWAWRRKRIQHISKYVTHMLVIFPFEETMYRKHDVPATYVGHPLLDRIDPHCRAEISDQVYKDFGLSPLYPVVGLFPGSRASEVRVLLPIFIQAAQALQRRFPRMQFILGEAPDLSEDIYENILKKVDLSVQRTRTGIEPTVSICDLAIVASGTATLELALFGLPMIVAYRVSPITFGFGRLLVRVPSIGMVNLVSQKNIVPELLQENLNKNNLYQLCCRFFTESIYYTSVKKELFNIKKMLGQTGASEKAAQIVLEVLSLKTRGPGRQVNEP